MPGIFADYMQHYRRLQQQTMARRGLTKPSATAVETSTGEFVRGRVAPGLRSRISQREHALGRERIGLQRGALGLAKSRFQLRKRMFPWALGISAANIGLSGLQAYRQHKQAEREERRLALMGG